jgi:hypothetical protein
MIEKKRKKIYQTPGIVMGGCRRSMHDRNVGKNISCYGIDRGLTEPSTATSLELAFVSKFNFFMERHQARLFQLNEVFMPLKAR